MPPNNPPTNDPYVELPQHVKQDIDVRHGASTAGAEAVDELTREQQLLQEAYDRRIQADRVVREAVNTRVRLLQDEARLLAQIEIERQEKANEQALRDEATALVEEATT